MQSKCPKCQDGIYEMLRNSDGYLYKMCPECGCLWTDWQQAEITRLTKELEENYKADEEIQKMIADMQADNNRVWMIECSLKHRNRWRPLLFTGKRGNARKRIKKLKQSVQYNYRIRKYVVED